ncbi:MAG: alpha/beta hydrolase [Chloroflexi bacterium]|nr:alpha/beta hydrolase [Chloroflexota bacterium]
MTGQEGSLAPRESRLVVNGVSLCIFEWPGDGPPVFFIHATGHHARCWDGVVRRMPGCHAYAIDLRGHGRSDKPEPPYRWRSFAEDVAAVADSLDLRQAVGVGHSMGGYVVTFAAALRPERFGGLALVDPTIPSPDRPFQPRNGEHPVARRRDRWDSPQEMFDRFRDRPPFNTWTDEALVDYCVGGLLAAPDGKGYVLACPPRIEASMYGSAISHEVFDHLDKIRGPVHVLRARPRTPSDTPDSFGPSVTWPGLAGHLAQGMDFPMPEHSHFIPQEAPEKVAAHILQVRAKVGAQASRP